MPAKRSRTKMRNSQRRFKLPKLSASAICINQSQRGWRRFAFRTAAVSDARRKKSYRSEVALRMTFGFKNLHDFLDRIPIATGARHIEKFLDLAEVADRFHLPAIETQDESVLDRNGFQEPLVIRR